MSPTKIEIISFVEKVSVFQNFKSHLIKVKNALLGTYLQHCQNWATSLVQTEKN